MIKNINMILFIYIFIMLLRFGYYLIYYCISNINIEDCVVNMMPLNGGGPSVPSGSGGGSSIPPGGGGPFNSIFHINQLRVEQYDLSERQIIGYTNQFKRALASSNPHNSAQLSDTEYASILDTEYILLNAKVSDFQMFNNDIATDLREILMNKSRLEHIRTNYLVVMHLEMNNRVPSLPEHVSILEQALNLLDKYNIEPFPNHRFRHTSY